MTSTEELDRWVRTNCPAELVGSTFKYGGGSHQEITDPAFRAWFDACVDRAHRKFKLGSRACRRYVALCQVLPEAARGPKRGARGLQDLRPCPGRLHRRQAQPGPAGRLPPVLYGEVAPDVRLADQEVGAIGHRSVRRPAHHPLRWMYCSTGGRLVGWKVSPL